MFYYTMSKTADTIVFQRAEKILDEKLHGFLKKKILIDVDGSTILEYCKFKETITLSNDAYVDAVLIDSTIKLDFLNGLALIAYEE